MKGTVLSIFLLAVFIMTITFEVVTACQGHDRPCVGANGSQGNCCGGMHCQKNDPSWAQGRCYYNPGK